MENRPIIRTASGDWISPRTAFVIPPSLQYQGRPLFDQAERNCAERNSPLIDILVDSEYEARLLQALGSRIFGPDQVRAILSTSHISFQAKGHGWIAALFAYLYENPDADPLSAPYIQIQNGQWTAPANRTLYVGDPNGATFDLAKVNIAIINPCFLSEISKIIKASSYLTERLKPEKIWAVTIIDAIFDRHSSTNSGSLKKECIAHAVFLTRHQNLIDWGSRARSGSPFYVRVARKGSIQEAKKTICNQKLAQKKKSFVFIATFLPTGMFSFLNNEYPPDVVRFLTERMGVNRLLPLTESSASRTSGGTTLKLHSIYTTVLSPAKQKSNIVLDYFSSVWSEIPTQVLRHSSFLQDLRNLPCLCEDGKYVPLVKTALRTSKLSEKLPPSRKPVLAVVEPESPRWNFLKELGVLAVKAADELPSIERIRFNAGTQLPGNIDKCFLERIYTDFVVYLRKCGPPQKRASRFASPIMRFDTLGKHSCNDRGFFAGMAPPGHFDGLAPRRFIVDVLNLFVRHWSQPK